MAAHGMATTTVALGGETSGWLSFASSESQVSKARPGPPTWTKILVDA
jgi:hypothetical protein